MKNHKEEKGFYVLFERIEIEWEDSVQDHSGWCSVEDFDFEGHKEYMQYKSVGYFLKKEDNSFFFCAHYRNSDGQMCGVMGIPFSAIKKITRVN